MSIKPLFMWAGGKTKMVKFYKALLPKKFDTYVEPFFGGGAMLLEAIKINPNTKLVIGDVNEGIINIYKNIQCSLEEFLAKMDELSAAYLPLSKEKRKDFYYELREQHAFHYSLYSSAEEAAVLYFLMKTGFNGIWQINKNTNNRFGTPCGLLNQKDSVYDRANVIAWNKILQNATILEGDFRSTLQEVNSANTWVFMDPPYRGGHTTYGTDFGDNEQKAVMDVAAMLHDKYKTTVWVTNRDIGDHFFDVYTPTFKLHKFPVTYTAGRRKKTENGFEAKKAVELLLCV